jgi:NADH-quinone oxidoreductase subunit F
MEKILQRIEHGLGKMSDIDLLVRVAKNIEGKTICPLGDAAAWPVASAIRHFRNEFEEHVLNYKNVKEHETKNLTVSAGPVSVFGQT